MGISIVGRTGNIFSELPPLLSCMRLYPSLVFCAASLFSAGCSIIPEAVSGTAERAPTHVIVPLVYASDRASGTDFDGDFALTDERGELSFGRVSVAVSTRREGDSPFADWRNWDGRNGFASDLNQMDRVEAGSSLTEVLVEAGAGSRSRDALLYVHGYARSFRRASLAFALAIYETDYNGIPVLFSWPSSGNPLAYSGDVLSQQQSVANLAEVIADLRADPRIDRLHQVAHRLGNQTLIAALQRLQDDGTPTQSFGEIVLFSPDYDRSEFAVEALPLLQQMCARVSLYVSGKDIPLTLSGVVNRGTRLGDSREDVFTAAAIETIDVSPVAGVLEGHTTLQNDPFIQADLHYLLVQGLGAAERPTLRPAESPGAGHWEADPTFSRK